MTNNIKTFDTFLNELRSVENKELIQGLDEFIVYWVNGILMYQTYDALKAMQIGQSIAFKVNIKNKVVENAYTFDDRSEFRFIKKVQQGLEDLIRDKIITDSWEFAFNGDKEITNIIFGNTRVSDILKYNSDFSKFIPIAFHGTSDYYLDEIKKYGLKPRLYGKAIENWNKGYIDNYSENNVYLSIDYRQASFYANNATEVLLKKEGIKSNPIVIEVKMLPTSGVATDDDFFGGHQALIYSLMTGKTTKKDYISGLRTSGQFAWQGTIDRKYINKIHKV